jgi:formyltetrahydrofolate synthetase
MAALLAHALLPNLVQTAEGTPALVHCGPFANIAHGNSSLLGTRLGLHLADWVVTESGFGADMGFEKLLDIVLRDSGITPSAVVVVATAKALKHHGGDVDGGLAELERGADNLAAHLAIVRRFGLHAVVAVNRFPTDDLGELQALRAIAHERGAFAAEIAAPFESGGAGCTELAEAVVEAAEQLSEVAPLYALEEPLAAKIEAIAAAYGAAGVAFEREAQAALARLDGTPAARLPVCMAKTHLSLSHDPKLLGAPSGFTLPVRDLRPFAGAGWVLALCGDMQTMPGLPANPAARRIDVEPDGAVVGLR